MESFDATKTAGSVRGSLQKTSTGVTAVFVGCDNVIHTDFRAQIFTGAAKSVSAHVSHQKWV